MELSVDCMYTLYADPILVGENGRIQVTGDVETLKDIGIYLEDGTLIGTTDEQGVLVTDRFSAAAGDYTIYAKDANGLLSFTYVVSSYNASGDTTLAPYGLMSHASANGGVEHSVTWFTNPGAAAQMLQYKLEGSEVWTTVDAKSERMTFSKGGNTMVSVHSAMVTGLDCGKTYVYRVGDGTVWSAEYTFQAKAENGTTRFFVLGDIQTEDLADVQGIVAQLKDQGYDFAIQTGDAVDDATSYTDWMGIAELFGAGSLGQTDVIHVLGNHEFAGDANTRNSTMIYNLPTIGYGGHYSVVYGDVYVAVINYTSNRQELAAALEWLKADAAAADAPWKVLTIHQPPYYTNVSGGNAEIHDLVPAAAEAAGIDFVFSGHDHSYARTEPLFGGQVDEKNGVVYIISGSTGEKAYSVTNNPDFHFNVVADDYESVYLTVTADSRQITVSSYDGGRGNALLDNYTKEKARCADDEHTYVYHPENGILHCSVCGYSENAVDSLYSGWATDSESDRAMYFIGGRYQTGYVSINSTPYFFDENGLGFEGEYTICNETCVFSRGQFMNSTTADVRLAGQCGSDVWFVLYANGLLKLGGTGPMYFAASGNAMLWYAMRTAIKSLYIGNGITALSNYAFTRASNLKTVEFEENSSLKTIGKQVFLKNYSLTEIVIPDSVTSMGSYLFSSCTSLTNAVLPSGTHFLTSRIFENCTRLTSVYIPDDVSKIADTTFYGCTNVVLSVAANSYAQKWAVDNNVPYIVREANGSQETWPIQDPETAEDPDSPEDFPTLPEESSDFSITASDFCGPELVWSFEYNVLEISGYGEMDSYSFDAAAPWAEFAGEIEHVIIGRDVQKIGAYAFSGLDKLTTVSFEAESQLTVIEEFAFAGCTELTTIELPDTLEKLGEGTFADCEKLTLVVVPASVNAFEIITLQPDDPEIFTVLKPVGVFDGCDRDILVLIVESGSDAEYYALVNGIAVQYADVEMSAESDPADYIELPGDENMPVIPEKPAFSELFEAELIA